jgi:hypothetical protein
MSASPTFNINLDAWQGSCTTVIQALITDAPTWSASAQQILTHPNPVGPRLGPQWPHWLQHVQQDRCFWCQGLLRSTTRTLDHVIPYQSVYWHRSIRLEQLLSLRISHAACNQAYARWRASRDPAILTTLDADRWHHIQQRIRETPWLQLLARSHVRPPGTIAS